MSKEATVNTAHPWAKYPKFTKVWGANNPEPDVATALFELAEAVVEKRPLWGVVFEERSGVYIPPSFASSVIARARFLLDTASLGWVGVAEPGESKAFAISSTRTSESLERKSVRSTDNPKRALQIILKDFRPFSGVEVLERSAVSCLREVARTARHYTHCAGHTLTNAFHEVVKAKAVPHEQLMELLVGCDPSDIVKDYEINFHAALTSAEHVNATLRKEEWAVVCVVSGVYFVQTWRAKNGYSTDSGTSLLNANGMLDDMFFEGPQNHVTARYTEASLPAWIALRIGVLKMERAANKSEPSTDLHVAPDIGACRDTPEGVIFFVSRNKGE
jgi:hypothetical protein